jgi:hypothetical protein
MNNLSIETMAGIQGGIMKGDGGAGSGGSGLFSIDILIQTTR